MLWDPEAHEPLVDAPWDAERARAAIRAIATETNEAFEVERDRDGYGTGRHSLWTGDPGVALYLADCLDGAGRLPPP